MMRRQMERNSRLVVQPLFRGVVFVSLSYDSPGGLWYLRILFLVQKMALCV